MSDAVKDLARAFATVLRQMRLASAGAGSWSKGRVKVRFGDWVYKVADKITPPLVRIHADAIRGSRGEVDRDEAAFAMRQRAMEAARSICDTTTEWLSLGYDDERIFGDARAAQCAVTEASVAVNQAKMVACRQRGKKVRWRLGGKACPICKKLNGRTIKPGKSFGTDERGDAVFGPPRHPNCLCRLVEV